MDPDEERDRGFGVEGYDELDPALTAEHRTFVHELAEAVASDLIPGG